MVLELGGVTVAGTSHKAALLALLVLDDLYAGNRGTVVHSPEDLVIAQRAMHLPVSGRVVVVQGPTNQKKRQEMVL